MKYKIVKRITSLTIMAWLVAAFLATVSVPTSAIAEDWPTYMHDNSRSGVTGESLDLTELKKRWVVKSPALPQIAWDGGQPWDESRGVDDMVPMRDFDFAFFVTVIGDSLYYGS